MDGFFKASKVLSKEKKDNRLAKCGSCGLNRQCISPKMAATGDGRKKILIVAEAPGEKEDRKGTQLIGKSGKLLRGLLKDLGVSLDKDCWKTNAIICRPPDNVTPDKIKIASCAPNLFKTIEQLQPNVIILLGGVAIQSLLGTIANETFQKRTIYMGWQIPSQRLNAWICPTYHPAYLLRQQDSVVENLTRDQLRAAIKLAKKKPYKTVPNYTGDVDIIIRPKKAISFINDLTKSGRTFAFDYEANCLKPEYDDSLLYSCSLCCGNKKTIAFPWHECIVEPLHELFRSKANKIAANMKFEDRWTRNKMNTRIRNWSWDTMLAAHVLDNRKGITGLKFQAFVQLGQESYNDHVAPLLKSRGKQHINRIHEIEMNDLLLYNGMDSLLTYRLAKIQMKKMGVEL